MQFVTCPKRGLEMEAVVLHRVGFLAYFCPKQGQDFKASAAPLYPNLGQVPPPPPSGLFTTQNKRIFIELAFWMQIRNKNSLTIEQNANLI